MDHTSIYIRGIKDDKLILLPSRDILVDSLSDRLKIKWIVETDLVDGIRLIEKSGKYPFDENISSKFKKTVKLKVIPGIESEWNYCIEFTKNGKTYKDDPLISIKPISYIPNDDEGNNLFKAIISLISLFLMSLFFWQRNNKNR